MADELPSEKAMLEQIEQLRSRMEGMRHNLDQRALLDRKDAIEKLSQSLAELEVAHEELRAQGDELAVVRHELERERQRYHELFDFAPDGYVVSDDRGVIREANRAAAKMFGVEPQFLVGTPISIFMDESELLEFRNILYGFSARPADDRPRALTVRLRPRRGEPLHAAATIAPARDPSNPRRLTTIRWMFRDVTPQKQAEQQIRQLNDTLEQRVTERTAELQAANRIKDRFLAALSHELRTPLTPALAAACDLAARRDLPPELHDEVEMIRRNIELETRLIDDLLDLTRVAHNKLSLDLRLLDVHEVLRGAVDICRPDIAARKQRLELNFEAPHHQVVGDLGRLHQIFWNLVRNAVKFTPDGGTISVRTRGGDGNASAGTIAIDTADTGIGIDPDLLPKLFNPFEQGGNIRTRHHGGLGLGLAISKALVDAHGGHLVAHSKGRGRGSRFTVTLPLGRATTTDRSDTTAPRADVLNLSAPASHRDNMTLSSSSAPLRILLVEDHADTARVLGRLLTADGHSVRHAGTVADALHLAASEPFDLLISDVGLPDGSGTDLARRLRERRGHFPGIALTGYGAPQDITATHDAGFAAHLTKPIDLQKLRQTIAHLTPTRKA